MNTITSSTQRILLTILVVCALLITVLFVFHTQHKKTADFSSNNSTLFPVGRPLQSFELWGADNTKFTQYNLRDHWSLIFFGFTHCATVCPTTLDMLSNAYPKLHERYPNLQVILVSLDPKRDSPLILKTYTKRFNPDFLGLTGKTDQLRKLQAQLHIFSSQEEPSVTGSYQIQHTSSIALINPKGEWVGLFSYGMSPEQFINEFEKNMNGLTKV